jgi:tRNA A-37 threonylcarbamoyl transferase component Bud32
MQLLDATDYAALRDGATALESDSFGEKVLRLADGAFLKLFRRKRLLSSAWFYPYAERFADNARRLENLAIPCPSVIAVYRIAAIGRDGVLYRPLAGETLRRKIRARDMGEEARAVLFAFGAFVARLHGSGVYFRSLHLGNVVQTPENRLGLIDIADLSCRRAPLGDARRIRNFRHLLKDDGDCAWIMTDGGEAFRAGYREASPTLSPARLERLEKAMARIAKSRHAAGSD